MKIRKLTKKDLPKFLELFNEVLTEDFPEYRPRVTRIYVEHLFNEKFFKRFIKKKRNCVLRAYSKNELIGALTIYGHSGGVAEFEWLLVDKQYRKKGLGTKLLSEGEKWAIKHKFHYLFFHTESQKNVEFYRKRGYEHIGLQKKAWFGIDEHLLQKILREEPFEEIFQKYGL